ncbi:MAG: phosphoribosylaminoimidazolesuccinocarboxamide synthase, partial [Clostridia bacterium]
MDNIEKLELLSEGKAKKIWKTRNKAHVIMEFKDFSLSYHGKHKIVFEGKGALSNKINNLILKYLEDNGISTHFQQELSDTETLVKNASMIPIEVVVRNYVAGSLVARTGLLEGEALKAPVLEFSYKCEELNDPMINEYHAFAMGLCTSGELDEMCFTALRMNKILKSLFYKAGLLLVD